MTAWDFLLVILRRWPLVLMGVALSLSAGYQATRQEVVYWTRFSVVALPPREPVYPNSLEKGQYNLTPLVGLVVTRYNNGHYPQQMSTADTTAYGEGMRSGSVVRLFNAGSQWIQVHDRPVVDVQVVEGDPTQVLTESERIVDQLTSLLRRTQEEIGVQPVSQVSFISSPETPVVRSIGGSPSRAAIATTAVGGLLTLVLVMWWDRFRLRRPAFSGSEADIRRAATRGG
jgi:hypothetical protein